MHLDNNQDRTWASPAASGPVSARVQLPASKSITNRALVLAALSDGPSVIANPLRARDTALAAGALRALGSEIDEYQTGWRVSPGSPATGSAVHVDLGNAGTVMRFVPGLAALTAATVTFDGDERIRLRPIGPILEALRQVGVSIDDEGRGAAPFTVHGRGAVRGGRVVVDASGSSQLVSGLLLAAPRFGEGIEVRHEGPPVPSAPHLRMTTHMLRAAGAAVDESVPDVWTVEPGALHGRTWVIEPDLSGAVPFFAAAMVTGGTVTLAGWPPESWQPVGQVIELLRRLGAEVTQDESGLTVRGAGPLHGVTADLSEVSELTPVISALAALADGPSELRGVAHIRGHETDRIAALATELTKAGAEVTEFPDGLRIEPRPLHEATFETYADHRMAHAAAVIGLAVPGITLTDVACTSKTLPEFPELWAGLVARS